MYTVKKQKKTDCNEDGLPELVRNAKRFDAVWSNEYDSGVKTDAPSYLEVCVVDMFKDQGRSPRLKEKKGLLH